MDQPQQQLRYAATRAFMESLNQLQETLQPAANQPHSVPPNVTTDACSPPPAAGEFDLQSFEQAVADIEQFMQTQRHEAEGQ